MTKPNNPWDFVPSKIFIKTLKAATYEYQSETQITTAAGLKRHGGNVGKAADAGLLERLRMHPTQYKKIPKAKLSKRALEKLQEIIHDAKALGIPLRW